MSRALPQKGSLSGMYLMVKDGDENLYSLPSFDVGSSGGELFFCDVSVLRTSLS